MISSTNKFIKYINNNKNKKILFLTGSKSFEKLQIFKDIPKRKNFLIIKKKNNVPDFNELLKLINFVKKFKPKLIIAIGGGAVIDYAKIVHSVEYKKNLKYLIEKSSYRFKKKICKLIAIPTTAGSGAEVTSNAVIYINKIKHSFENKNLKPDTYFLIPDLLSTLEFKIRAESGFDVIAQALESLISVKSNKISIKNASKALKISLKNYFMFLKKPNIINSTNMLIAANLSGKAINISKTTAPHAISYPFTSFFGINHGHAVSLFIEDFFLYNFENACNSISTFDLKERFNLIFKLFDVKNIKEFKKKIKHIKKVGKLEDDMSKLSINLNKNLKKIVKSTNQLRLRNNPVPICKSDLEDILLRRR